MKHLAALALGHIDESEGRLLWRMVIALQQIKCRLKAPYCWSDDNTCHGGSCCKGCDERITSLTKRDHHLATASSPLTIRSNPWAVQRGPPTSRQKPEEKG